MRALRTSACMHACAGRRHLLLIVAAWQPRRALCKREQALRGLHRALWSAGDGLHSLQQLRFLLPQRPRCAALPHLRHAPLRLAHAACAPALRGRGGCAVIVVVVIVIVAAVDIVALLLLFAGPARAIAV
jgi:hypothetical protein